MSESYLFSVKVIRNYLISSYKRKTMVLQHAANMQSSN